jgi:hypothetical protein
MDYTGDEASAIERLELFSVPEWQVERRGLAPEETSAALAII